LMSCMSCMTALNHAGNSLSLPILQQ
jgi:hypothetical protein